MGVYRKTIRSPLRTIDGHTIGLYSFAYRNGDEDNPKNQRLEAIAEKTAAKMRHRGVNLFIEFSGKWSMLKKTIKRSGEAVPVYHLDRPFPGFYDTETLAKEPIGYIVVRDDKLRYFTGETS
jgi:hypothetical protein